MCKMPIAVCSKAIDNERALYNLEKIIGMKQETAIRIVTKNKNI